MSEGTKRPCRLTELLKCFILLKRIMFNDQFVKVFIVQDCIQLSVIFIPLLQG